MSKIILATVTGAFLLTCVAAKRKRQPQTSIGKVEIKVNDSSVPREEIVKAVAAEITRSLGRSRFGHVVTMGTAN